MTRALHDQQALLLPRSSLPEVPRFELRDPAGQAMHREWLLTDGTGASASSTVAAARTRPDHGLLVAPVAGQRRMFWQGIEEEIEQPDQLYLLSSGLWRGGAVDPQGFRHIERFWLDGTLPVWQYRVGAILLEKRVWMAYGRRTTYIQYRVLEAPAPVALVLRVYANSRPEHARTEGDANRQFEVEPADRNTLRVSGSSGDPPWYLLSLPPITVAPQLRWSWGCYYPDIEGAAAHEDTYCVCSFHTTLRVGDQHTLVGTLDAPTAVEQDPEQSRVAELLRQQRLLARAGVSSTERPRQRLVLAADQFVVTASNGWGAPALAPLITAGYPWTGFWSRDALAALPGLLLATGRLDEAAALLRAAAAQLRGGLLPDRWPDTQPAQFYNADAALWFIHALRSYVRVSGDHALAATLYHHAVEIVNAYRDGTATGITVQADGLVYAANRQDRLTWMDHHSEGRSLTPRPGKPVEINALWYNALQALAEIAPYAGHTAIAASWSAQAEQVARSFGRFWYGDGGYLYDVIDGPNGNDAALRPNQLFAIGLPDSPLAPDQGRAVFDAVSRSLLTPNGLRTLAPHEAAYHPRHAHPWQRGNPHQGSAWPWLLGIYADALLRVAPDADRRASLQPLIASLDSGQLGSIAELFDAEPPQHPHGRTAHALGVAELLRVLSS